MPFNHRLATEDVREGRLQIKKAAPREEERLSKILGRKDRLKLHLRRWPQQDNLPWLRRKDCALRHSQAAYAQSYGLHHRHGRNSPAQFRGKGHSQCTGHPRRIHQGCFEDTYLRRQPFAFLNEFRAP